MIEFKRITIAHLNDGGKIKPFYTKLKQGQTICP